MKLTRDDIDDVFDTIPVSIALTLFPSLLLGLASSSGHHLDLLIDACMTVYNDITNCSKLGWLQSKVSQIDSAVKGAGRRNAKGSGLGSTRPKRSGEKAGTSRGGRRGDGEQLGVVERRDEHRVMSNSVFESLRRRQDIG